MTDLKVFEFEKKAVRVETVNGEPWFVAKDVCDILGLEQVTRAMSRLDTDEGGLITVTHPQSPGKTIDVNAVNESGLYSLILCSEKPEARRFKKWITSEVIPSIRKTGSYTAPQTIEERSVALITDMLKVIKSQEQKIIEDKPKVEFFEAVCSSKDCVDVGTAAKVLNLGIGRNTLFEFLRNQKIFMDNNVPFQRYIDLGYFRVIEQKYQAPNSDVHISYKTMVYQTGLSYIKTMWTKYLKTQAEHTYMVQEA